MKTPIREEKNREYIRTGHSSRARPRLHAERESDALGGRWGVHLSAADRPGVLVAVALLGGGASRRGAGIANAASVGRPHLLRGGVADVRDVVAADAQHRRGQKRVESSHLLQHQSRRQKAPGMPSYHTHE